MPESPRIPYTKAALTEADLLARWRERGLAILDQECATRYLRRTGYYRFSAYVPTFEGGQHDVIHAGTNFDDVLNLYIFDRKLRLLVLVLDAIERIEVAVRAAMSDHSSRLAGPYWYEDAGHFENRGVHEKLLAEVDRPEQLRRRWEQVSASYGFVSALGTTSRTMTNRDARRPGTFLRSSASAWFDRCTTRWPTLRRGPRSRARSVFCNQ